jgi:hypothetical protein
MNGPRALGVDGSYGFQNGGFFMSMGSGGLGGGNYFNGPQGPWMGCGCSSILIVLAGLLLVMGGCARMLGQ